MSATVKNDIRRIRSLRRLKQNDLARKAKVPLNDLSMCERGLILPDQDFFKSIANVLQVSADNLFETHSKLIKNPSSGEGYVTSRVKSSFMIPRRKELDEKRIPVIDIYSGTGGFSHGFEQTKKFEVVAGIDLLPDRVKTFSKNHPTANSYCEDIRKFSLKTFTKDKNRPKIIIGGPPCQGFSSIRPFRSVNEKDVRNNLFEYFALAVDLIHPEWFVLENVVGLLTHQKDKTFKKLLSIFEEMGYTASWNVINSAHFGLPQRRERLIVVGNCSGKKFQFPKPTHYFNGRSMVRKKVHKHSESELNKKNLKPAVTVMDAIKDLPKIKSGRSANRYSNKVNPSDYAKKMRKNSKELTLHEATNHSTKLLKVIKFAGSNIKALPEGLVTSGFSTSYSRLEANEPSVTITVNFCFPGSNKCIHPFQNRALTPREAARLQGFEDSYVFKGNRNQIIKQIGNAVPPLLGKIIADEILKQM